VCVCVCLFDLVVFCCE